MAKNTNQEGRKAQQSKTDQLANLKELRRLGVLTRQQFRLQTFDKGLQGSTKGSPMITEFVSTKTKGGSRVTDVVVKQWVRIDK